MKMNIRKISVCFTALLINTAVFILSVINCNAQAYIPLESSQMQMAYRNQAYLSFNVKYTYAAEADPLTIIDSSMGAVKMSGNYYWGTMDSLEFMQNNNYNVVLYKNNRLMRIGNPETVYPQIINFSMFDSLAGKNNYTMLGTVEGAVKNLQLNFSNPSFPYKSYKVSYDSITHFVNQITYTINDEVIDAQDSYNKSVSGGALTEFVIVTAKFTNYQTIPFSTVVFNSSNYFLQNEGVNGYTPQPPYQQYELFIASPNLLK
jgi:hypothetical protein